ncbi:MAG: M23 family metallopeptidase [Bacteroidales bacterium]|nr:M23 family metallopeptidase [Bacteroidales bacterium]MBQ2104311.1 M23 family metallopeptidase [Bacteroidales bacterium]
MSKTKKENKVKDFRVSVVDDASHRQIWERKFTRGSFIAAIISTLVILALIAYCLLAFTPLRTTIPGYPNAQTKRDAIQNAIKIDSLENIISRWELYSINLGRIVDGEEPYRIDSTILASQEGRLSGLEEEYLAGKDSLLRQTVMQEEQFSISGGEGRQLTIEGMHFFTPLSGVVSQGFDPVLHPYIDITAPAGSVVLSILDGTVIFAGWNDESGYTIQIQHANDIVSIYKHNQKLLKKTGDKVSAGASIALVGNTGSLTTGDHLHFELWYKGDAVDPTKYISF